MMEESTPSQRQRPEQSSGTISIEGDTVRWHSEDLVFATFNLLDIVVIGEHTNSSGPWFDDWFITFVTRHGTWFSIPWYADNVEVLTKILCEKFEPGLDVSYLTQSTTWKSIVRYPKRLKEKPLFVLVSSKHDKAPNTLFDKLLSTVGLREPAMIKEIDLTDEVKEELMSANR
jgi:hypothetical protein